MSEFEVPHSCHDSLFLWLGRCDGCALCTSKRFGHASSPSQQCHSMRTHQDVVSQSQGKTQPRDRHCDMEGTWAILWVLWEPFIASHCHDHRVESSHHLRSVLLVLEVGLWHPFPMDTLKVWRLCFLLDKHRRGQLSVCLPLGCKYSTEKATSLAFSPRSGHKPIITQF